MIPRLEAQPLMDAIERRGGLLNVVQGYLDRIGKGRTEDDEPIGRRSPQYGRVQRALHRARKEGTGFTVFWLDDFIVQYLRLHPCEVYGDAWFEAGEEQVEAAAA